MKTSALVSLFAALMTAGAAAAHDPAGHQPHSHPHKRSHSHPGAPVVQKEIRINCFRGPLRETIWDHPRAVFIDDLVDFGYDYPEAQAIAIRVCRDVTAVGRKGAMSENLLRAIAETPPGHKR